MKYCVIIADGMADRSFARLQNRTPLEIARTPAMNKIASTGRMGMVRTIPEDLPPESLVACMTIFGLDPTMYYTGKAAFEVKELGISLEPDEWVFCCDLISTFDDCIINPNPSPIRPQETEVLLNDLRSHFRNEPLKFYRVQDNHHLVVCHGIHFSNLTFHNPFNIIGRPMAECYPQGEGRDFLIRLMKEAHEVLKEHEVNKVRRDLQENPADSIWLWGGGQDPLIPHFEELNGMRAGVIASSLEIRGLSRQMGMDVFGRGLPERSYTEEYKLVMDAFQRFDLVFVYLKELAEFSRQRDLNQKIRILEKIDEKLLAPFLEKLGEEYRLMIVGGHFISCGDGIPKSDPVPFLMGGKDVPEGTGLIFHEKNAQKVDFFIAEGEKLLSFFLQL